MQGFLTSDHVSHLSRSEGAAVAARNAQGAARSSGPIFGAKSGERGTARLKGWYIACSNCLIFNGNYWYLRRFAPTSFRYESEKSALVRELSLITPLKTAQIGPDYDPCAPSPRTPGASISRHGLGPSAAALAYDSRLRLRRVRDRRRVSSQRTSRRPRAALAVARHVHCQPHSNSCVSVGHPHPSDCYCDVCVLLIFGRGPSRHNVGDSSEVCHA